MSREWLEEQEQRWAPLRAKLAKLSLEDRVNILVDGKRGPDLACNCGDALDLDCRTGGCDAALGTARGYLLEYLRKTRRTP